MWDGVFEPGITMCPCWTCQRRITWAGKPVTILKNNRPWVVIQPAQQAVSAVDVAVDFMDAYADVFEELAK